MRVTRIKYHKLKIRTIYHIIHIYLTHDIVSSNSMILYTPTFNLPIVLFNKKLSSLEQKKQHNYLFFSMSQNQNILQSDHILEQSTSALVQFSKDLIKYKIFCIQLLSD